MILRGALLGRARLWRNMMHPGGRRATGATRGRPPLVAVVLIAAMSVVATLGLRVMFDAFAAAGATTGELASALGFALTAAFAALIMFDLDAAAATLLVDRDLSLLRRAPLSTRAIVGLKLLDALPRTAVPLLALALPALVAFAMVCPLPAAAWLALPLLVALLWIIAMGVGLALLLPLLASVPPRRAREALSLLATLTLTVLWLCNALLLPRLAEFDTTALQAARALLDRPGWVVMLSPGQHLALAMRAIHEHDAGRAIAELALLGGVAAGAAGLALAVANRLLPRVLERVSAPALHEAVPRPRIAADDHAPRGFVRSVLRRDLRLFTRDWTVLADVLTAAVLWTILPMISRVALNTGNALLARAMIATLAVGLGYEIAARAFPLERRGVQWIALAPIAPARWLMAKLAGILTLAVPLIGLAALVLVVGLKLGPARVLPVLGTGLSALLLSISIGLWTGCRFGDYRWTHPRAMLTLPGRLTAAAFMIVQLGLWLGLSVTAEILSGAAAGRALLWIPLLAAPLLAILPLGAVLRRLGRNGLWS